MSRDTFREMRVEVDDFPPSSDTVEADFWEAAAWRREGFEVYRRECGGGGDCMFHALADALADVLRYGHDALPAGTACTGRGLRLLAARELERVTADPDGDDSYPMSVVGDLGPHGDRTARRILYDAGVRDEDVTKAEQRDEKGRYVERDALAHMRRAVGKATSRFVAAPGIVWGNHALLQLLERALVNVRIVVLDEDGEMRYAGDASRPIAVLLYFVPEFHYQRAVAAFPGRDGWACCPYLDAADPRHDAVFDVIGRSKGN